MLLHGPLLPLQIFSGIFHLKLLFFLIKHDLPFPLFGEFSEILVSIFMFFLDRFIHFSGVHIITFLIIMNSLHMLRPLRILRFHSFISQFNVLICLFFSTIYGLYKLIEHVLICFLTHFNDILKLT